MGVDTPERLRALSIAFILGLSVASAQNAAPVSLTDQLGAQYKLAKLGQGDSGIVVVGAGTVLQIQKPGIVGAGITSGALCESKYEGGNLKNPGAVCRSLVGSHGLRYFNVGDKVYPIRMDVNLGKDRIHIVFVECDACNGAAEPAVYKSEVVYQFAKGSLSNTSAPQVEDTLGQVLAIVEGGPPPIQDQAQNGESQPASQPDPQTIRIGQTTDQVVAALGKPEKIVDLGAKQLYVYKDLKVTFMNGKVADVQ